MVTKGEYLPMVVLYVIWSLSGYWCVFAYLLLGGLWWWPCCKVYLVCKYHFIFIWEKKKMVSSVEYES